MDYLTNDTDLKKVADAIRAKGGTSAPLAYPNGFVSAIQAIKSAPATPYMVAEYEQEPITENESVSYIKKAKLYNHTRITALEFARQYKLQELDMSDPSNNITIIEQSAFMSANCENVIIPDTVALIGNGAFSDATIGTMIVPGNVTEISDFAFSSVHGSDGSQQPVIQLNEGLATIGNYGFNYCNIAAIEIPSTVTKIGGGCFSDGSLITITCKPTQPPELGSGAFSSEIAGFTIKVPAASVAAYKAADGWKDYANYIVAM